MNLWAEIKDYFKQIKIEIKRMFKSRGMIVFMIILLLFCVGLPVLVYRSENKEKDNDKYSIYDAMFEENSIKKGNPFSYIINELNLNAIELENEASDVLDDLALEYVQMYYDYYYEMAEIVTVRGDYRVEAVNDIASNMQIVFIIDNMHFSAKNIWIALEKAQYKIYDLEYIQNNYYNLSEAELEEKYNEAKNKISQMKDIVIKDDYFAFADYEIINKRESVIDYKTLIEDYKKRIVINPDKEDELNESIQLLEKTIKNLEEIDIPILEYRKANSIKPDSDEWQNEALHDKSQKMYFLMSKDDIKSESEFYADKEFSKSYSSYREYEKEYYEIINYSTEILLAADKSLEYNKPDRRYIDYGSRARIDNFLDFNIFIVFFAIIIGGGLLSKEFKSGTIRLLLIRPKRRIKIALSRLAALIIITLIFYFVCVIANAIANGVLFGMKDLSFPNYTIKNPEGISFFTYILPRVLLCFLPVIFFGCMAYCLSSVTKNTALAVSIPFMFYIAALIVVQVLGYDEVNRWLSYTPLPYINMTSILWDNYYIGATLGKGGLVLSIGIVLFVIIGNLSFAKRDVKN